VQQIQMLAGLFGLGLATATGLAREVFYRTFRDRKAIASPRLRRGRLLLA
jgi:hypothetical protein